MIWKVLKTNIKVGRLTCTFAGILFGLTILMAAVAFYFDVKPVFADKEGFWKDEYIIVNKKIMMKDTYSQISNFSTQKLHFSAAEIASLQQQPFVKEVARFVPCSFAISAYTDNNSALPGLYTDLFFEAVPDKFVDVNTESWKWNENQNFIPVIIPKMYLNLYNFGFAQSQSLPQISESGAGLLTFNVRIAGRGQTRVFTSGIVGFSDRINTILVPLSFVEWANRNFGSSPQPPSGRLILIANDPSNPQLFKYLESHNYDVNKSELSNSKALVFLKVITTVVLAIGLIIIALAFAVMVVSIQLLLYRNNDNISKLAMLGFRLNEIVRPYNILVCSCFAATFALSTALLLLFRHFYTSAFVSLGYANAAGASAAMPTAIAFVLLITFSVIFIIRKNVAKLM